MDTYFIRESVLTTAIIVIKLDGTILFHSTFSTCSSHHIVFRVASNIAPCVFSDPAPNSEKDYNHGNNSGSVF